MSQTSITCPTESNHSFPSCISSHREACFLCAVRATPKFFGCFPSCFCTKGENHRFTENIISEIGLGSIKKILMVVWKSFHSFILCNPLRLPLGGQFVLHRMAPDYFLSPVLYNLALELSSSTPWGLQANLLLMQISS